jgi:rhodanese-related sulfurtransferase
VVRPAQPIVLVAEPGRETEARVRLARIGFDHVVGALTDVERALTEHPDDASASKRLAADDLGRWEAAGELQVVDVRNPGEQEAGIIPGSRCIPIARLLEQMDELDPAVPTVVCCAGGYRSSTAASLLRANGFATVADLQGGFAAWEAARLPVVMPGGTPVPTSSR